MAEQGAVRQQRAATPTDTFGAVTGALTKQAGKHGREQVQQVAEAWAAFEGDDAALQSVIGALAKLAKTHGAPEVRQVTRRWAEFVRGGAAPAPNGQAA